MARRTTIERSDGTICTYSICSWPGRANLTGLVLGCIEAKFLWGFIEVFFKKYLLLEVNTRWKALAEIYTMPSFAPFSNLNFFVKNRQNVFAIELMNFINSISIAKISNFAFFCEFLVNFFRISRQIPEKSDVFRFFNQICENKLESCRKF